MFEVQSPNFEQYRQAENEKIGKKSCFFEKVLKGENLGEIFSERGISPTKTPKGEIPPHLGECGSFDLSIKLIK